MSDDMKRLLRGLKLAALIVLPLAVLYFGWSAFRASRERLVREDSVQSSLKHKQDRQRAFENQAQYENARRLSAQRKPSSKPSPVNANRARNVDLRHVTFSPDGRFLAAAAQYQDAGELMVWPAGGGATLIRKKYDFGSSLEVDWNAKNTLIADGVVFRVHKDKGFWDASELPRPFPVGQPGRVDSYRNFPRQDVRLQIENYTTYNNNTAFSRQRLAAYSLITKVNLPLPPALESQNSLEGILPLARWGKAPLRLARWKTDVSSARGSEQPLRFRSVLEVWDARAKKRIWQKSFPDSAGKILVGQGGRFLLAIGTPIRSPQFESYRGDGIEVYDAEKGKIVAKSQVKSIEAQNSAVSPDGNFLAVTASPLDSKPHPPKQVIYIYQVRSLKLIGKINFSILRDAVSDITFSPDNNTLAVATIGRIRLYNWRNTDAKSQAPSKIAWF